MGVARQGLAAVTQLLPCIPLLLVVVLIWRGILLPWHTAASIEQEAARWRALALAPLTIPEPRDYPVPKANSPAEDLLLDLEELDLPPGEAWDRLEALRHDYPEAFE